MKFPLSQADNFVEQIEAITAVATANLSTLSQDIQDLVKEAPENELSNTNLVEAFIAITVVAKRRDFDLAEAILKVLS